MLDRTESETLRVATGMIWIPGGTHGLRQAICGSGAGPNPETNVQKASCKIRAAAGTTRAPIPIFPTSKSRAR
jgi:hypothetical protein